MGLMQKAKDARAEALEQVAEQKATSERVQEARSHAGVEYRVETVREKLIGDHVSADGLQGLLNKMAGEGWSLKQLVEADVKGRVGPGGVGGLLAVFERPAV